MATVRIVKAQGLLSLGLELVTPLPSSYHPNHVLLFNHSGERCGTARRRRLGGFVFIGDPLALRRGDYRWTVDSPLPPRGNLAAVFRG